MVASRAELSLTSMQRVPTHANEGAEAGLRALRMTDMPDGFNFLLQPPRPPQPIHFMGLSDWTDIAQL